MQEKMRYEHHTHEFPPVYDENSRILILGSFPSVKSRQQQFYYGHPQNRFWQLMAQLLGCECPLTIEEKKKTLLKNHIALWDVIKSCDIVGSSDSSIKNVSVNDFRYVLEHSKIQVIYANGNAAKKLFEKYAKDEAGCDIVGLPSTSPANAAYSLEKLMEKWQIIVKELSTDYYKGGTKMEIQIENSERAQAAIRFFKEGYNCSQAVVLAFEDLYAIDRNTMLALSSSFGGGMGRMREVCGSVSGMFMVAGLLYGYDQPKAMELKTEHYARIQELAASFREKTGSIVCRELLGLNGKGADDPKPEARTASYYKKRPCGELVGLSAAIMENYIKTHPYK